MKGRSNPRIAGVQRVTGFLWIILVSALLVGVQGVWGAGFGVTDLSGTKNQITITANSTTYNDNVSVNSNGIAETPGDLPSTINNGPVLSFKIVNYGYAQGSYTCKLGVTVDDDNSFRRIEAYLENVNVTVNAADGSVQVTIPDQTMEVRGRNSSGTLIGETTITNDAPNGAVVSSGATVIFDASNLRDKIQNKLTGLSGLDDFMEEGAYTYSVFIEGITVGTTTDGTTVSPFPRARAASTACGTYTSTPSLDELFILGTTQIDTYFSAPYVIRGQFKVGTTANPGTAPSAVVETYNGSCPSSSTSSGSSGAVNGGTVAPGGTGSVSAGATVSDVTNEGTIKNSGTIQDSTNKGTIEGGTVAGTITNTGGTLKDVAIGENAVVKGGNLEGAVTIGEGASLENVTVAANATVNFSGADIVINIVTESGSKMVLAPGSSMHGVVSSSEGASLNLPEGAIVTITGSSITIQFSKPSIPVPGQATITALTVPVLPVQYTLVDALTVSPDGATLAKPATVTIPYDNTMIPASFTQTDLKVLALDPTTMQWKEISVTSVTDDNVTIDTDIMSTYAVVVSSLYPVISTTVGNVVDPESVSTPIEDALKEIFSGQSVIVNPDKTSGILNVNIDGVLFPISAIGTGITGSQSKASFELKDSGLSAQFILSDGTTIRIVPIAADPQGLSDLFVASNFTVQFQPDYGMVIVKDASNNMYAGMFGWTAGSFGTKSIDGFNSTDGIINIVYEDGSTQTLAPVLGSIQNFITDLNNAGIAFNIDRNTGIINLINSSSCWIPDYTIEPLPFADLGEYIPNKDAYGIYFKVYSSSSNIEMWTNVSKQLIGQTQCK